MSNARLIAHWTPVRTGGRTSNSDDGLSRHEHRSLEQQLGRGRHDAQAGAVRAAGVDERYELGGRELEAGHDDVVGSVLGNDLLEVGQRAQARGVGECVPARMLADRSDHAEIRPTAVTAQRALECRELAERADEHGAAVHAEHPHRARA